jgi:hypothetical protein
MANRPTPSASIFILTAWDKGKGCLSMSQLDREQASARIREWMLDERCAQVSIRTSGRMLVVASRASAETGGYRGPDGTIHQWTTTGVEIEGVARTEEMFEGPGFAEGWGYADADFAAKREAEKDELVAKLSETEEGRELLARWGHAA